MSCRFFWNHLFVYIGDDLRYCKKCDLCQIYVGDYESSSWFKIDKVKFNWLVTKHKEEKEIKRLQRIVDREGNEKYREERLKELRKEVKKLRDLSKPL